MLRAQGYAVTLQRLVINIRCYSAEDEQTLGTKLRAPGDEWSLPSDAKYRVVKKIRSHSDRSGPHRERFY